MLLLVQSTLCSKILFGSFLLLYCFLFSFVYFAYIYLLGKVSIWYIDFEHEKFPSSYQNYGHFRSFFFFPFLFLFISFSILIFLALSLDMVMQNRFVKTMFEYILFNRCITRNSEYIFPLSSWNTTTEQEKKDEKEEKTHIYKHTLKCVLYHKRIF